MSTPVRVLIADDHPIFRDGLASLLETQPGVEVVGTAGDGLEAVAQATALVPDVVVMDLQMPQLNGIDATRRITETLPDVRVLVFTMGGGRHRARRDARRCPRLPRQGRQPGGDRPRDLDRAGGRPGLRSLAGHCASPTCSPGRRRRSSAFPQLTERELEILDLIAAGKNKAQIASVLYLAPKAVRNNVSTILAKLQATDRAEAIILARDAGLGGG